MPAPTRAIPPYWGGPGHVGTRPLCPRGQPPRPGGAGLLVSLARPPKSARAHPVDPGGEGHPTHCRGAPLGLGLAGGLGSSATQPARHCLAPRGGHGPAHSHFRGEFRPGPRPSLASVHTASLAPHGPLGYGSSERAHQPCSARTQDPAVATSAADAASRVRGSPLSKVSTADDERGLAQPTKKKRGSCREARGPGPRTRRSPCGGGAPPTYRGGSAHV